MQFGYVLACDKLLVPTQLAAMKKELASSKLQRIATNTVEKGNRTVCWQVVTNQTSMDCANDLIKLHN